MRHLGDREDAHDDGDDVEAVQQLVDAEGEAEAGRELVGSDRCNQEAKCAGHKALEKGPVGHDRDGDQPGQGQHRIFRRREIGGKIGKNRRQQDQHQPAEQAAES